MKKYNKTFNTNKIKSNFPYYVCEIAEKLGVTKGTVYAWIKEGLQPIDGNAKYIIISGSELRRFLKNRQDKRKSKCKSNEMFCFKCQLPRRPLEGKTSIVATKGSNPNLTGKCSVCNSQIFRTVSPKNLPEFINNFKLEQPQSIHLVESITTTSNYNQNIGA